MRRVVALTAATTVALALTACSPQPDGAPVTATGTTAPVEVAPEPLVTPEPDPVPAVGATISTPEEVAAAEGAGLGVYVTAAGASIVIDPAAPVPQVIIDEARASGMGPVALPDSASSHAAAEVLQGVADRAAAAGKKLVFIIQTGTYGDWDDDDLKATHYSAFLPHPELRTGPQGTSATPQEARQKAQTRIDAQPDPGVYEIVDLTA